ncbi:MAG TPA: hypothetical protein VFZ52_06380 [Chryseolinea sp.]
MKAILIDRCLYSSASQALVALSRRALAGGMRNCCLQVLGVSLALSALAGKIKQLYGKLFFTTKEDLEILRILYVAGRHAIQQHGVRSAFMTLGRNVVEILSEFIVNLCPDFQGATANIETVVSVLSLHSFPF